MDLLPSSFAPHPDEFYNRLSFLGSCMARRPVAVYPLISAELSASPISPRAVLTLAISQNMKTSEKGGSSLVNLLVPTVVGDPQDNIDKFYTAMTAHAVAHLLYSPAMANSSALKPISIAVISAVEDARVERLLCRRLPGVRQWFEASIVAEPSLSDLTFNAFMTRLDRILLIPDIPEGSFWVNKARDLFESTVIKYGLEDHAAFKSIASILANDLGQMRVYMDPQYYVVPSLYKDDNSYLWTHQKLETHIEERIPLKHLSPINLNNHAEVDDSRTIEIEIARFSYPEWDQRLERLKTDWCTVIDKLPAWQGLKDPASRKLLPSNSAPMLLSRVKELDLLQRNRRQWDGDEIDFNAAIEVLLDLRLNLMPDPRIYIHMGQRTRPTSLLVLMDVSESANDINSQGISLLDIEKQVALSLAQSNISAHGRLAIHAFSSNTRAEVSYYRLLDFGQIFDTDSANLICTLQGRYSTRLGAALRHATSLLATEPCGNRAVLVISDGEPSDIDVHNEQYLIEDARQAVQGASRLGTRMRCIAVDTKADDYVRRIFGASNSCTVTNIQQLPNLITQMSARIMTGS
ncbi:TPA: nitric oxide reductase activation protein NorD [Serratia fonticola]